MKGLFKRYSDGYTYSCYELIFAFDDISETVINEIIKETELSEDDVYMLFDGLLDSDYDIQYIKMVES